MEPTGNGSRTPTILQIVPQLVEGGVERGTTDIARYLTEQGWRALVTSAGGPLESEIRAAGLANLPMPLHSKNPLVMARNVQRLQRLIRGLGVDLVHARSRAPAWSAYHAARRCGVPFVTTFHSVYSGRSWSPKRRYNAIMTRGERVIAISEYVAQHMRETYGVPGKRVRVISRGVDLEQFDPAAVSQERIAKLAAQWGLQPGGKPVVMLPARVTRRKGHLLLLDALQRIANRDIRCLLVGGTEPRSKYPAEITQMIQQSGLEQMVDVVGSCDDMPAALMLADVVVAPSITPEAFGRMPIEAQAMGKPVIVTDMGALSETIMPAATGWVVPPNNADELAQALDLALAMPDDARERVATRARNFVERSFTLDRMGHKTMAVYRELLQSASAGVATESSG